MPYAAKVSIVSHQVANNQNAKQSSGSKPQKPLFQPKLTVRERCFLPCKKSAWITFLFGSVTVVCGGLICSFAFHSPYRKLQRTIKLESNWWKGKDYSISGPTMNSEQLRQQTEYLVYSYCGPVIVGIGLFIQMMAWVILFVERDKIIKQLGERMIKSIMKAQISKVLSSHGKDIPTPKAKSSMVHLLDQTLMSSVSTKTLVKNTNNNLNNLDVEKGRSTIVEDTYIDNRLNGRGGGTTINILQSNGEVQSPKQLSVIREQVEKDELSM